MHFQMHALIILIKIVNESDLEKFGMNPNVYEGGEVGQQYPMNDQCTFWAPAFSPPALQCCTSFADHYACFQPVHLLRSPLAGLRNIYES